MDEELEEKCIDLYKQLDERIRVEERYWSQHNSTFDQFGSVELLLEHEQFPRCTVCPRCSGSMPMAKNMRLYECNRCIISLSWRVGSVFEGRSGIKLHQMIGLLGVVLFLKGTVVMNEIVDTYELSEDIVYRTMEEYRKVLEWHMERLNLSEEYDDVNPYEYFLDNVAPENRLAAFFKILKDYHREVKGYDIKEGIMPPRRRGFRLVHGNPPPQSSTPRAWSFNFSTPRSAASQNQPSPVRPTSRVR